jgi:hypothetical protein
VILVPAVILVVIFAALAGIAHGDDFWSATLAMVTAGTAVQLGYLVGMTIRAGVE